MQAGKEWRVVTQFLEKLCTADGNEILIGPSADCESLTEIDYSMFIVKETGFILIGLSRGILPCQVFDGRALPLSAFEVFVMLMLIS